MINHHQAAVTVTEPVEPIEPIAPAEPPLPAWTGPYPPPPLVAHLYRPFVAQPRGRPPQPSQPRKVIYE